MPHSALGDVLAALGRGKPVIVYGPPGTGKTRLMNELRLEIEVASGSGKALAVDRTNLDAPIVSAGAAGLPQMPGPVRSEWITFHQGYGYEDFVLGLMPRADGQLEAVGGPLLEAVHDVVTGDLGSVVLFIDELNRANVARVFGELITFLDPAYRLAPDGTIGDAVPFHVKGLPVDEDGNYAFRRRDGKLATLPRPLYFPQNVFIVATMNSVDRTAVPVDAAVGRRFERIALRPSVDDLAAALATSLVDAATGTDAPALAVRLYDRVNAFLGDRLEMDAQIGHGTMIQALTSDPAWPSIESVARAWDDVIVPHVEEAFAPYPHWLREVLRVDDTTAPGDYPYVSIVDLSGNTYGAAFQRPRLSDLAVETATATLSHLASADS